jgi:hypothetical protein
MLSIIISYAHGPILDQSKAPSSKHLYIQLQKRTTERKRLSYQIDGPFYNTNPCSNCLGGVGFS